MTVTGEISSNDLGVTLMHEHILNNNKGWWHCTSCKSKLNLVNQKINPNIYGDLKFDPFVNKDNLSLDNPELAVTELNEFIKNGGNTIVDPTNIGIGRSPKELKDISNKTGLNIIMGSGFYLEPTHPKYIKSLNKLDISDLIQKESIEGVDNTNIRIGIVGEIGISKDFTKEEEKVLRGSANAACILQIPLSVHLPGWERHGQKVLDISYEEGCIRNQVILCHMNPSFEDIDYQYDLANKGAWLEYDMIGMDYYYADQDAQCPYDNENAKAIKRLINDGFIDSLLLSHDVFLKMMLKNYGGFGYSYILTHFKEILKRTGVSENELNYILTVNPKNCFNF